MDREYILRLLYAQINVNGHIIGAAVGSGMTAKFAAIKEAGFSGIVNFPTMALIDGQFRERLIRKKRSFCM